MLSKNEESCELHLKQEREKAGVICSHCGGTHHRWNKWNKCWICSKCGHHTTLRSVMGLHDGKYKLNGVVELDDGFFTCRIDSDAYPSHGKLGEVASEVNAKVVKPKDAPKALP